MKHHERIKMYVSTVMVFGIAFLFYPGVLLAGNARAFSLNVSKSSNISKPDISKNKITILPVLSLPQTEFVFSKVVEGKAVLHTFAVKNKGSAMLKIYKVRLG